jgi:S-adenosylmethionine decarboxylase
MHFILTERVVGMKLYDTVGAHILADFWGCDFTTLNDAQNLVAELRRAAGAANMTVLGAEWHQFEPQGCTAMLLLSESHISIHTYPERGYAAVDVFTCGGGETAKALEHLETVLKPASVRKINIRRGVPEDAAAI